MTSSCCSMCALKVAFTLVSADDGSSHSVEVFGEALDASDKATAKAMSAAYKSAMVQTFCIPVAGQRGCGRCQPQSLLRKTHVAEPVQGWEQWARDIEDIVAVCESEQAIGSSRSAIASCSRRSAANKPSSIASSASASRSRREALAKRHAARQVAASGGPNALEQAG